MFMDLTAVMDEFLLRLDDYRVWKKLEHKVSQQAVILKALTSSIRQM